MDKKIKVAQIIGKGKNGGVEACILNYYKAIDRNLIEFHFFLENTSDIINEEIVSKLNGKIILTPKYTSLIKYIKFLKKTFSDNNYDIVHSNLNSLSVFPLFAAWLAGIKIRIAHSHSTTNKKEVLRNIIKNFLKLFSKVFANRYFACSELAGIWLFGKKTFKNGKVFIINNAIDINRFKFNFDLRREVRQELGISNDTILLGNIGRLCKQKNQFFLLEILKELDLSKFKLLILGQGELKNSLLDFAKKNDISNNVIFVDSSPNPEKFYNAFDVFLLPSLYEGLPVSGIEAQINSLPCFFSDCITKEVKIYDEVIFLSIRDGVYNWCNSISKCTVLNNRVYNIINNKFDINSAAKVLENIYLRFVKELF